MKLATQDVEDLADAYPGFISISKVCKYLDISRSKVYKMVHEGKLDLVKFGWKTSKITVESLNRFIDSLPRGNRGSIIGKRTKPCPPVTLPDIALADFIVRHSPSKGELSMANFQDILNRKASDIKPPPAYPVGTYHCLVDGPPSAEESSQKGTPCRVYRFRILSPGNDVNPQDLAQIEGGIVGKIITGQPHAAFYLVETAVWRYKEFLTDALAIEEKKDNGEDKTLLEMEAEAAGKQLLVKLKQEISQDGKRMVHRIDSYARV